MHPRPDPLQSPSSALWAGTASQVESPVLDALSHLLDSASPGELEPNLALWAERYLDSSGTIPGLAPAGWREVLSRLAARPSRPGSSPTRTMLVARLRRAVDAFQRPDGSIAFGPLAADARTTRRTPRPPAAFACHPGPVRLAIRDRLAGAELFLALDESQVAEVAHLELYAHGRLLIDQIGGGVCPVDAASPPSRPAVWSTWTATPEAVLAEYCKPLRDGAWRQRTVVWLRSRRILILAEEMAEATAAISTTAGWIRLAGRLIARPADDGMGLWLDDPAETVPRIRVIAPSESGSPAHPLADSTTLRFGPDTAPGWRPLLFILDPRLAARPPILRTLTVTQQRAILGPELASAYRLSWPGQTTSLVVYRSRRPGPQCAFLGHQTDARLLIGSFSRSGELTPFIQQGWSAPDAASGDSRSTTSSARYTPGRPRPSDDPNACEP